MCPSRDGGPDRRGKNPVAASPFGFVRGKSALQAEITLLSGSCTARGAGNIELHAITKPAVGGNRSGENLRGPRAVERAGLSPASCRSSDVCTFLFF